MTKLFLVLASALIVATVALRAPTDKPNFIVFFVDDLGYGDLGFTGHPTTKTPFIDSLCQQGKKLTNWYSAYPVCTASRTSLLTGRYVGRTGMPGVIGPAAKGGLPLNETTIASYLKTANYTTAAIGKWHLGQREMYLPGNRGFDYYLGIPYSVDMGTMARESSCNDTKHNLFTINGEHEVASISSLDERRNIEADGVPLPLVQQMKGNTTIREQPLDLTKLIDNYNKFALDFLDEHYADPFFLYVPFSHVHVTIHDIKPFAQYASCAFINTTARGRFGDALHEVDWMIENIITSVRSKGIEENTLVLFTSDNGPWLERLEGSGSAGLFTGRASGYWNTGKGSTWEGGVREPAFAYWKGQIPSGSWSDTTLSTMDILPTLLAQAGVPHPTDRIIDGKDMSDVLTKGLKSAWVDDFLYMYNDVKKIYAVRHGDFKAHYITAPGLGGCKLPACKTKTWDPPLLFNVMVDPSEAYPLEASENKEVIAKITAAKTAWEAKFEFGQIVPGSGQEYTVCCDRAKKCICD